MAIREGTPLEKFYRRGLQTAIMLSREVHPKNRDRQRVLKTVTFGQLEHAFGHDQPLRETAEHAGITELIVTLRRENKYANYEAERIFPLIDP